MKQKKIIVIGAGIGGLTAGALLASQGYQVKIFEQAYVPGGCASTFKRKGFTFDVGATQVAGLESGGIHDRLFKELGVESPKGKICEPACAVFLPGETEPINVWRDPQKWQRERNKQFPGSEKFWQTLQKLFEVSWRFQGRDPVLPPRNLWDLIELIKAVRLDTLMTAPFALMTVGDVLRLYGLDSDRRLSTFLDLQLKLYSQVDANATAVLYAATALNVSQAPQGLFHLYGSMQVLSDRLTEGLTKHGGQLYLGHKVEQIEIDSHKATSVTIRNLKTNEMWQETADHMIGNLTVQDLVKLIPQKSVLSNYRSRVANLPPSSGAFVIYLGVEQEAIPADCPPHLQFLYDYTGPIAENNSLFVSVSQQGDGRAPDGKATIIASSFTDTSIWWNGDAIDYDQLKQKYTEQAITRLSNYFRLSPSLIAHQEAATPRTFARYTARDQGIVGGIGQRISTFGPFGFATRTPIANLWLVGDSTHPGEGTAGVSYAAATVVKQIQAS